jgi:HEAT repeat protein
VRRIVLLAACGAALVPASRGQGPAFLGRQASAWARDLSDVKPDVRRSAAFALGRIGGGALAAAPELTKCLQDADAGVRAAAARAVGDIVVSLQGGGAGLREAAGTALADALAADTDSHVRAAAAYALGAFREESAAPALRKALHDPDARVRRGAVRALSQLGQPLSAAANDLTDLLQDPDALVRRDAAAALGAAGSRAAVRPLVKLAKGEGDGVVRRSALRSLVELVGPEDRAVAIELYPLLALDDLESARKAALALGKMGADSAPAVPVLAKMLREDDEPLQIQAAAALAGVGPEAAPAVPALVKMLTGAKSTAARVSAAVALGKVGSSARDAVPVLTQMLASTEPAEVRTHAAEALMDIGSPANDSAVPALLRIIESDFDPNVRHKCALSVSRRRDYESSGVARTYAKVLAETGPETALLRYEAAYHLATRAPSWAPDRTVDVLLDLYKQDWIRTYRGTSLKVNSSGSESDTGKTEMKRSYGGNVYTAQITAAQALGCLGKKANRPEVLKVLRGALNEKDDELRQAAKEALDRIDR